MASGVFAIWTVAVAVAVGYIVVCPYTKVEESFNLQAIHDHIFYGVEVKQFDHNEFPGVVPRTFVGSLIVGYITKPLLSIDIEIPRICIQYAVRLVLCMLLMLAYLHFLTSVRKFYGSPTAVWSCLLTVTQFHFLFYSSRPLPNTFAAIFALLSCSYWIRNRQREFVFFAGWVVVIFRSELAIMFGLMLLITLVYGQIPIWRFCLWILITGVISLGTTVLIDSFYWQRWVWPEGEAFYFNAILNKSSDWGTSPFLWYFYSALPRAMGLSLLFAPLGMAVEKRCLVMAAPAFGFVFLYSILPHKELRFILYVVPILNVVAARICSLLWHNRSKGLTRKLACLVVIGHLLVNAVMTGVLTQVSYSNYPGGKALQHLNQHENSSRKVHVHIDTYSAQTGVSRFLNEHSNWNYDKTENTAVIGSMMDTYTHLLVGTPDEQHIDTKLADYSQTHKVVHTESCFKNIHLAAEYPYIKWHGNTKKSLLTPISSLFLFEYIKDPEPEWKMTSTRRPRMCHVGGDQKEVIEEQDEAVTPIPPSLDQPALDRPQPDGEEDVEALPWHHAQLVMLYGRHVADDIMYPKMDMHQKTKVSPKLFDEEGHAGAAQLWSMLRNDSEGKLLKEDRKIPNELKESYGAFVRQSLLQKGNMPVKRNFYETDDVPDMEHLLEKEKLLKTLDIRHKIELMGRSSKINANRTGVLLHNNPIPDLVNASGEEGIDRYLPSWIDEDVESVASYRKWVDERKPVSSLKPSDSVLELVRPHGRDASRHKAPPKVKFLTEAEAGAEKGTFSSKYKDQRDDTEHSVRNPVDDQKAIRMEELKVRPFRGDVKPNSAESVNKQQRPSSTWEPLTLNALVDYSSSKKTQGSGNFSNGAVKMFPLTSEVSSG